MYDESHIGNDVYSTQYKCPNCGSMESDYDGYCVKCGEQVIQYNNEPPAKKINSKSKENKIIPVVLTVVGLCLGLLIGCAVGSGNKKDGNVEISYADAIITMRDEYVAERNRECEHTNELISILKSNGIIADYEYNEIKRMVDDTSVTYKQNLDTICNEALDTIDTSPQSAKQAYDIAVSSMTEIKNNTDEFIDTIYDTYNK